MLLLVVISGGVSYGGQIVALQFHGNICTYKYV